MQVFGIHFPGCDCAACQAGRWHRLWAMIPPSDSTIPRPEALERLYRLKKASAKKKASKKMLSARIKWAPGGV